ncbi:hypothetical protein GCM10027169_04530 [Gordonia jinhuaensis]|uniref:Bacterioferritin-associated ferredoxin n=1 Tax=Gordonia jinhuaensis TaxID=1517702 RepID=A0A916STL7_9ACTN|nr:(2Fe-2S)-binding protein [Gordonia jinhuaensis]GGB17080.1 hypothetical protein GCM10011489_01490 [Gordonia jinhuaensis]
MFACICRGVTDDEVREYGACGAVTADDVGEQCGAGWGCGTCVERIEQLIAQRVGSAA